MRLQFDFTEMFRVIIRLNNHWKMKGYYLFDIIQVRSYFQNWGNCMQFVLALSLVGFEIECSLWIYYCDEEPEDYLEDAESWE